MMIAGAHVLLFSADADADRNFVRDVLKFPSVDAGRGWLIFALPPSELAIHPLDGEETGRADAGLKLALYLMCTDVHALITAMAERHVDCAPVVEERWGLRTAIRLPSGGQLGVYQPTHPTAI
jgi:hypothetical protein